jgi:hypothetical protein
MCTITEECVVKSLEDESHVCVALESTVVSRSLPRRDQLSVEVVDVLVRVLEDGYIVFDPSVTAIRYCYEKGLIHRILARTFHIRGTHWGFCHRDYMKSKPSLMYVRSVI